MSPLPHTVQPEGFLGGTFFGATFFAATFFGATWVWAIAARRALAVAAIFARTDAALQQAIAHSPQ